MDEPTAVKHIRRNVILRGHSKGIDTETKTLEKLLEGGFTPPSKGGHWPFPPEESKSPEMPRVIVEKSKLLKPSKSYTEISELQKLTSRNRSNTK